MPNWTESQLEAIYTRGKSLVVSAGAGSGKTSVLTERILQKILAGSDIGNFLVVTFTKAAAADLRAKLYNGLNKALAENPTSSHLYRQLFGIEGAYISTIHSFCFDLVRQNFQSLGLSPNLRIADQTEADLLLSECVKTIFDRKYEQKDKGFLLLIEKLTDFKGDSRFTKSLIEVYNKVRSFPYPDGWFENCLKNLQEDLKTAQIDLLKTECGRLIIQKTRELIEYCRQLLDKAEVFKSFLSDKQIKAFSDIANTCDNIEDALDKNYAVVKSVLSEYKISQFKKSTPSKAEEEAAAKIKAKATDILKQIKKLYVEEEEIIEDYEAAIEIMTELRKLYAEIDKEYSETKRDRGILDFSDLEHMSLKLLSDGFGGRSELCEKLSESFEEIYIDEYQDTNPIQDMIFSLIARKDNKFIVGDVKQSLYRFRNAEPKIFNSYIGNDLPYRKTLFLSKNFRCEKPIIEFTNRVFEYAYDGVYGKYGENEKLVYGKISTVVEPPVVTVAVTEEISDEEREAEFIADEILRLKRELRKSDGTELKYSDFAILMRAPKNGADVILKALRNRKIPTYSEKGGSFLDAPEILLMMSLLKAVDNPRNDIALTAVLRSPVFSFTASELAEIRKLAPGATMYDSVRECARRYRARLTNKRYICTPCITPYLHKKTSNVVRPLPHVSMEVSEKASDFLNKLAVWQIRSEGEPAHKFIWYIYGSTGLYSLASRESQGDVIQKNLLLLYEYAREFEQTSFRGLNSFISYISEISDNSQTISEASAVSENNDCVRIMSIHHSKGLEFEVCFIANANKEITKRDLSQYVLHRGAGIFFKKRFTQNLNVRKSFIANLYGDEERYENDAESMRALYVALTRAKTKLIVTGCKIKNENKNTYLSCICNAFKNTDKEGVVEFKTIPPTEKDEYEDQEKAQYETVSVFENEKELEKRLLFVYPHASIAVSKIAVSELESDGDSGFNISETHTPQLADPAFLSQGKPSAAEAGTAMHMFIQFADFHYAEKNGAQAEARRLIERELLTEKQFDMLDFEKLDAFFKSTLYNRIKKSPSVIREKRFSIMEDSRFFGLPSGGSVMVQGVIDLFFEENGAYIVVDFKTDRISENKVSEFIDRHIAQLSYYCRAIERMSGKRVKQALLYSFALGRDIETSAAYEFANN